MLNSSKSLDLQQIFVQTRLSKLALKLEEVSSRNVISRLIYSPKKLKSLYIYGSVGRGKTMLMKEFFDSLQKTPKVYFHFNNFMRLIHEALRDIRKEEKEYRDELVEAVKRVVETNKTKLICFDEFQVTDIADAMLLSRIFSFLFSLGITAVFTSNSEPKELYKNGLQREVFLQFINEILLKNCEVLFLDSPTDYRAKLRAGVNKRYFISNSKNREELKKIIEIFTENKEPQSKILKVWGRDLKIAKTYEVKSVKLDSSKEEAKKITRKIAVINFDEICRTNLAAADYQAISQNFDLIFLLKLPSLASEEVNEVRRLTLFIDEIYENKTALIILAKTIPTKIYPLGTIAESFKRTVSRLKEIKSDEYWKASKIN